MKKRYVKKELDANQVFKRLEKGSRNRFSKKVKVLAQELSKAVDKPAHAKGSWKPCWYVWENILARRDGAAVYRCYHSLYCQ